MLHFWFFENTWINSGCFFNYLINYIFDNLIKTCNPLPKK
jgi:hypothetical protein